MLCDLFGCECGGYIAPNKCLMNLNAKGKLKWFVSDVDVREGLPSVLTKIVEKKFL